MPPTVLWLVAMTGFLLAGFPIAVLIVVMTKPRPLPSTVAFFLAAALAYLVRLTYFGTASPLLNAGVIAGLLDALTPIAIIFGAIFFFVAMEKSGAMLVLQEWLRGISANPVAQLMLVGWSFIFLIEGASGFGTPAALAAPVLVALGFPVLRVAILCLIFNAIPTAFGAVGTPMWFGFEALGLSGPELVTIGARTALFQTLAALVLPVVALRFVVDWGAIRRNLVFIYLSILSCVLPMLAVAQSNTDFPAVVGGVTGLITTILLARSRVGLEREAGDQSVRGTLLSRSVLLALAPLVATVVILLVTRIRLIGLRQWLTTSVPNLPIPAGPLGELTVSPSLVIVLRDILGQGLNWSHAVLYVPSIIPFAITAGLAFVLFRVKPGTLRSALSETVNRIGRPVIALLGALVFVSLLMVDGDRSSTNILGHTLAEIAGGAWKFFAPSLGALGSFFSGSTTISNLTFGGIQASIANDTGIDPARLLALQCAGAAMGNIVCIHNIVAVCAVLGLVNREGEILKATVLPMLLGLAIFAVAVSLGL